MNITTENAGQLQSTIKIQIAEEDYRENVNNALKETRKKAEMKGFRKGMVPVGLIKKMYGKAIIGDEINKIVSKELRDYLVNEKINFLGEPLPNEEDQKPIDWDNQSDFEFVFDIGLAPEFELNLSFDEDLVPYYSIIVDDTMIDAQVESMLQNNGEMIDEEVASEESNIVAEFVELDEKGNAKADGIEAEEAKFLVRMIKDEDTKKALIGANKQQIINLNIRKAFEADAEIASLLGITKEEAANLNSDFQITIKEITKYVSGELNQNFFDKVFGEGVVKTEEEFRARIKENIEKSLVYESDYKFQIDIKKYILDKVKFDLPVEFLKRWLLAVDEKLTPELLDKDWESFDKDLRWQIITSKVVRDKEITVEEKDIKEAAIQVTKAQFQQYGIADLPDDQAEQFSQHLLNNEEQRKKLEERKFEEKTFAALKDMVQLDKNEISSDDFRKLFETKPPIETEKLDLAENSVEEEPKETEK